MKMQLSGQMRLEQRLKLAPKMIQSMEILQLTALGLQERIEAELNSNPVLELNEPTEFETPKPDEIESEFGEKDLVVREDNKEDGFERLADISFDYHDYLDRSGSYRSVSDNSEIDKKLDALNNTAAPSQSLNDYLLEQWRFMDLEPKVRKAGEHIIDYIDEKGYLTVRIEQLYNKDKYDFTVEDLKKALEMIQTLEPTGVGARDLRECLLIQLKQDADTNQFEIRMISEYMPLLLENKIPQIARKMKVSVEQIKHSIKKLSKLDTSPGLQIGRHSNPPINADIIVEPDGKGGYTVKQTDDRLPSLRVNHSYLKMVRDKSTENQTRQFLQNNIRNAQWLMEAIEQRKNTLLNVATSIVQHQKEFLDKGQLYLKPLPMAKVADEVGVHIATVSRAVAGKYMQCPQGIIALRDFFGGGKTDADSQDAHSYDAIRAKLQEIIDNEDKSKPLNDDDIKKMLAESGLGEIARRTVAKYRKIMNIPTARLRKRF